MSLDNQDLLIVTSAAASTFNNIGPLLGTTDSFAIFSPLSKLIMGFAMIAGRLEIYPLLLLFLQKLGQNLSIEKLLWIHLSKGFYYVF